MKKNSVDTAFAMLSGKSVKSIQWLTSEQGATSWKVVDVPQSTFERNKLLAAQIDAKLQIKLEFVTSAGKTVKAPINVKVEEETVDQVVSDKVSELSIIGNREYVITPLRNGERNVGATILGANVESKVKFFLKQGYSKFLLFDTLSKTSLSFGVYAKIDADPNFVLSIAKLQFPVWIEKFANGEVYTKIGCDADKLDLSVIVKTFPMIINGVRFNPHSRQNDKQIEAMSTKRYFGAKGEYSKDTLESAIVEVIKLWTAEAKKVAPTVTEVAPAAAVTEVAPAAKAKEYERHSAQPKGYNVFLVNSDFASHLVNVLTPVKSKNLDNGKVMIAYSYDIAEDMIDLAYDDYLEVKRLAILAKEEITLESLFD